MTIQDTRLSFEFFPPGDDAGEERLWGAIEKLAPLGPDFLSVTFGAGGSTRDRTNRVVKRISKETDQQPAAHLTCCGATKDEVHHLAREWWANGIRHIVALRGDPPRMTGVYSQSADHYSHAAELIGAIKEIADFEVSAAAYPEVHPDSPSVEADLDNLKAKVDAGADRLITQFFFEPEMFLRFRDRCARWGIDKPLVPGIMPVFNFEKVANFAHENDASVPQWLYDTFAGLDDDPQARKMVAASVAADLCSALQREGVDRFHFYTLNRADLTYAICRRIGIKPELDAAA
jgi:methylenetetrahydrofolate reductase (NADPH)